MKRRLVLRLFLLSTLVLSACAGTQRNRPKDLIDGLVVSHINGEEEPVPLVKVLVHLGSDEDWVGVATTNYAGRFTIAQLSNRVTQQQEPLRRDTTYDIRMEGTSHYIFTQRFTFTHGFEQWVFPLEPKDNSLPFDVAVSPSIPPDDERTLVIGATPRRAAR